MYLPYRVCDIGEYSTYLCIVGICMYVRLYMDSSTYKYRLGEEKNAKSCHCLYLEFVAFFKKKNL